MAEKTSFGVARLRQAITNQATCGGQFELSIDSADRLCREIEAELGNPSWAKDVPVPRDADGEVVPLDTEELYTDKDETVHVERIIFQWRSWYVKGIDRSKLYFVGALHLNRPNGWERLEKDAKLAPRVYLEERGLDPTINDRVAFMATDLVRRAKALAERGDD